MTGPRPSPDLPAAVSGQRRYLQLGQRRLGYYADGPESSCCAPPLLLIHSINAAGSAYEMKPIHDHYRALRRVYAVDLPGFGASDRLDEPYTPRLMTDAILAMAAEIARLHAGQPMDAVALSLSSEYLARAATETPRHFRSLAFVSPTGFSRRGLRYGPPGSTRGRPLLRKVLTFPVWGRALYRLLTTRTSIRFFLRKTWGSSNFDAGLAQYDFITARQPGAHHAPYWFLSGFLFSADIGRVYEALRCPAWLAHGTRGDFVDYTYAALYDGRPTWSREVFETGALPHFESPGAFIAAYDAFLARAGSLVPRGTDA